VARRLFMAPPMPNLVEPEAPPVASGSGHIPLRITT
jgi:hypothetical protein